jgi:hypothetical protein
MQTEGAYITEVIKLKEYVEHTVRTHQHNTSSTLCEISSSHGGEYDVQSCLLGCTAV